MRDVLMIAGVAMIYVVLVLFMFVAVAVLWPLIKIVAVLGFAAWGLMFFVTLARVTVRR